MARVEVAADVRVEFEPAVFLGQEFVLFEEFVDESDFFWDRTHAHRR